MSARREHNLRQQLEMENFHKAHRKWEQSRPHWYRLFSYIRWIRAEPIKLPH